MPLSTTTLPKLILSGAAGLLLWAQASHAELAIIVHRDNQAALNTQQITRLFLGKLRAFPGGQEALPIDHPRKAGIRLEFGKKVLKKSPHQLRAYWSAILFTGKGTPPAIMQSDADIKQLVAKDPRAISYIHTKSIDNSVRVVKIIP